MTQYFRDFGVDGIADFTERQVSGGTAPTWAIQNTDEVISVGSNTNAEAFTWDALDSDSGRAEIELVGEFKFSSSSAANRVFFVRWGSGGTGYSVRISGTSMAVYKSNGATQTSLGSATITASTGTFYWIRFRIATNGGTNDLFAKFATSKAGIEGAGWDISGISDSTYNTVGPAGLVHGGVANDHIWRNLGVGTNGDTAPSSGGGGGGGGASMQPRRAFPRPILMF